ncbi:aminoglycoside adenylyltransferase domain-containing protein [Jeotgalibacillus soli]|uniref:Spectinomycin 9-adenylyltransferase n=1 Tax=Jeotgalibacillus soli TaxID=889306 RepID=A0A0C2VHA5_9BACL|nr:aminoglycoside adenylyltransferase domain-containing protein [Jeotgalibacillus soli]KIL48257.1 hypothetical protein KP78_17040 [Jeotgalibacillus soli]
MNVDQMLEELTDIFAEECGDSLTGVYLHGSLAMTGYHISRSDVDLVVVVEQAPTSKMKHAIIERLLTYPRVPLRGVEVSIVLHQHTKLIPYPTPFELHYSESLRKHYETVPYRALDTDVDYDLVAHFMMIKERGICLYGEPIPEVFGYVSEERYLDSILRDVENVKEDILKDPVYYVLNLCRILYYVQEGVISSKKEAGEWAVNLLPGAFHELVEECLLVYRGQPAPSAWNEASLIFFATSMLQMLPPARSLKE